MDNTSTSNDLVFDTLHMEAYDDKDNSAINTKTTQNYK